MSMSFTKSNFSGIHGFYLGNSTDRSAHTTAKVGDYWLDTTTGLFYTWNGSAWAVLSNTTGIPANVGTIGFPLNSARILSSSAYQNGTSGFIGANTNPSIARVNGATDISARMIWASSQVQEVQWEGTFPDDVDDTIDGSLILNAGMGSTMDTPVLTVAFMVGTGATDLGSATAALSSTMADKTIAINFPASCAGQKFAFSITPGAHGNDAVWLGSVRLTYTRK